MHSKATVLRPCGSAARPRDRRTNAVRQEQSGRLGPVSTANKPSGHRIHSSSTQVIEAQSARSWSLAMTLHNQQRQRSSRQPCARPHRSPRSDAAQTAAPATRLPPITADIACRRHVELSPSVTKRPCPSGGRRTEKPGQRDPVVGGHRPGFVQSGGRCGVVFELSEPRVLVCGSRRWPWQTTVEAVLDGLATRHGEHLVVIEGAARGADYAAHLWCQRHGLPEDRHRCHPVDWRTERRARPSYWRLAGPERNSRMLLQDRPRLIVCFHDQFDPASGGTSDMVSRPGFVGGYDALASDMIIV
jgi:hypothetical protein